MPKSLLHHNRIILIFPVGLLAVLLLVAGSVVGAGETSLARSAPAAVEPHSGQAQDFDVLQITPRNGAAKPGRAASYTVTLTNPHTSAVTVTLGMSHSHADFFSASLSRDFITDVPESMAVTVALRITPALSPLAPAGLTNTTLVQASFEHVPTPYTDTVTTTVLPAYSFSLTVTPQSLSIMPDSVAGYALTLQNSGNVTDAYDLQAVQSHDDFTGTLSLTTTGDVAPGDDLQATLTITPQTMTIGLTNVTTVSATSQASPTLEHATAVTTTLRDEIEVYLPLILRNHCTPSLSWTRGSGMAGVSVKSLAVAPTNGSILYGGAGGKGVYRSTDRGLSWQATGLSSGIVYSLAVHPTNPQIVYAATYGSGVLRTKNGGASWAPRNAGLQGDLWLNSLDIDPSDGQTLYVGTSNSGVYKTTTGGASWVPRNTGLGSLTVRSVTIDPTSPEIVYAGTAGKGIYKTTDWGANWTAANSGMTSASVWNIVVDPTDNSIVYAATANESVFKSTDGGSTWTQSSAGLDNVAVYGLVMDPRDHETLYAGLSGEGVYRTLNAGASWTAMNEGLGNLETGWLAIDSDSCPTLHAGTGDGIWWRHP
jgi:photosystem II stability/assembly factor-like uncharacterized protein